MSGRAVAGWVIAAGALWLLFFYHPDNSESTPDPAITMCTQQEPRGTWIPAERTGGLPECRLPDGSIKTYAPAYIPQDSNEYEPPEPAEREPWR